jgi:hypothetical protein
MVQRFLRHVVSVVATLSFEIIVCRGGTRRQLVRAGIGCRKGLILSVDLLAEAARRPWQPPGRWMTWRRRSSSDQPLDGLVYFFWGRTDLKPHKSVYWLNSHDRDFDEKARETCQLYVEAPQLYQQGRLVIRSDEKAGMQILERKYPTRPVEPGKPRCHSSMRRYCRL